MENSPQNRWKLVKNKQNWLKTLCIVPWGPLNPLGCLSPRRERLFSTIWHWKGNWGLIQYTPAKDVSLTLGLPQQRQTCFGDAHHAKCIDVICFAELLHCCKFNFSSIISTSIVHHSPQSWNEILRDINLMKETYVTTQRYPVMKGKNTKPVVNPNEPQSH